MLFLIILIESSTQQKISTISQQKTYNLPLGKQWWGKNYSCLARNFLFIYHSFQTLHLWMSIYFSVCKTLLMEKKNSIAWKTVKDTWNSSLLIKIKSFGKRNYEVSCKMAEGSGTKWWRCCSIKLVVKIKNVSFIFH